MSQADILKKNAQPGAGDDIRIANRDGARELVLVVDDEPFATLLMERILVAEGYRVVVTHDGFEALRIYRKLGGQIDLTILDYAMPLFDGFAVFNELRMINPQAAVVLTSGLERPARMNWMLENGLLGFIPKPHTQKKLVSQVRTLLDAAVGSGAK
ncbi:MAG TPA: response regulator [Chthoniobacteraceae bacterium]|jgi:CheY-like chemotaxis protein|nr:response regulator [Chthoniobacteraceae bacterium]